MTCVLGDNGAGKSTLIKIIAGLHDYTEGTMKVDGAETRFSSPAVAQGSGIATVYQDLALAPLMSVWRNFFLGNEIRKGAFLDVDEMKRVSGEELTKMGIVIPDLDEPVGGLSGGQRQCVAIARAIYFGARVVILDEPTAALGVKQSGVVLKYIIAGPRCGPRGHLHHPQPAPRLPGGQPLHHLEAGQGRARRASRRAEPGEAHRGWPVGQELAELSHELRSADPGKVVEPHSVEHGAVAAPDLGDVAPQRSSGSTT